MSKTDWITGNEPIDKGWYAISCCWDVQEGIIPGAAYWNGSKWDHVLPIGSFFGVFANEESAKEWAYDNDVEA